MNIKLVKAGLRFIENKLKSEFVHSRGPLDVYEVNGQKIPHGFIVSVIFKANQAKLLYGVLDLTNDVDAGFKLGRKSWVKAIADSIRWVIDYLSRDEETKRAIEDIADLAVKRVRNPELIQTKISQLLTSMANVVSWDLDYIRVKEMVVRVGARRAKLTFEHYVVMARVQGKGGGPGAVDCTHGCYGIILGGLNDEGERLMRGMLGDTVSDLIKNITRFVTGI